MNYDRDFENSIQNLNIRQKQVYASLCLKKYCQHFKVRHEYIDELITHLFKLASAEDLVEWEKAGRQNHLLGRGDPLHEDLQNLVPEMFEEEFRQLIDNVIEVGIVDLFGASTDNPDYFLNECIKTLREHSISLPSLAPIEAAWYQYNWGPSIDESYIQTFEDFKQS